MENSGPQLFNTNVETAILSAIIFDNDMMDEIGDKLLARDFYLPSNRTIYEVMSKLRASGKPIDDVFLLEELREKERNPEEALLEVMSANPISNVSSYLQLLKDFSQKRMLFDLSIAIRKGLDNDTDAQKLVISAMDSIEEVQNASSMLQEDRKMSDITAEIRDDMTKAQSGEKMPFYPTGYPAFDASVGGLVENGLTVIAGRPSMGKSSFTSGPIVDTLEKGDSVVLYSMEVADKNALVRLVSFKSQEPLSDIKKGLVSGYAEFNGAMQFFEDSDDSFFIVDRSGMTKRELELDIIRKIKSDPKLKLIIVDHLLQIQLSQNGHAPTELGEITKMLKRISQNYKVTVVLLSQLNRGVESRDNKRPMLADLQGSGSIEQDADMIVFLYRSEYYKEKEWDQEKDGIYQKKDIEQAEVIIGKNRDGPTGSVELGFKPVTASFIPDHIPVSTTDYIDEECEMNYGNYPENDEYKASTKENNDTITVDIEEITDVSMPLI